MLKWLLTLLVALLVLALATPALSRFGLGRLPGDLRFQWGGRAFYLPFTTTVILSLLLTLIARFV